jgi:hypothetical protein
MTSDLVKLQLAWLEQGLAEYEAQLRMQDYLDAGLDPKLAAAAANAELHQDEIADLYARVERLERLVAMLIEARER